MEAKGHDASEDSSTRQRSCVGQVSDVMQKRKNLNIFL